MDPIASGGMTPGPAAIPVLPIVRTRKKVPMNSVRYLGKSSVAFLRSVQGRADKGGTR